MWMYLFEWAKDMKILVFHVNAHQNVTLLEEEFNNQASRITHSVDSRTLSPNISVMAQWAHEQNGHWREIIFSFAR